MDPQGRLEMKEGPGERAVDQGCGWTTLVMNASHSSLSDSVK